MSFVAVALAATTVITAASSAYSANQTRKTMDAASKDQKAVDIGKLVADARANSEANLKKSLELEKQYLPGQGEARNAAAQNFLSQLGPQAGAGRDDAMKALADFINRGQPSSTPTYGGNALTQSAADSILQQLNLGGALDPETQSAVVRGALSGGGRAGIVGSEAGRGLVARDLGLTSLQLQQSRQQNALNAGVAQSQLGVQQSQLELSAYAQFLQSLGLNFNARQGQLANSANIFELANRQALPESGLSSGSLADISVGETNRQNKNIMDLATNKATANAATLKAITTGVTSLAGQFAQGAKDNKDKKNNPTSSAATGQSQPAETEG